MQNAATMIAPLPMSPDERTFFQTVGSRIARCRKEADLTQVQLADTLGIPQPQLASYEVGRRRVPVSMLPPLARALAVPIETLVGEDGPQPAATRRGPASRVQQQLERIQRLPRAQQRFVMQMIDTVLQQAGQDPASPSS
jgi:transcriptional regulator with XRE-family HTH domain